MSEKTKNPESDLKWAQSIFFKQAKGVSIPTRILNKARSIVRGTGKPQVKKLVTGTKTPTK